MYNSQFELGYVALNVRNLKLQSLFYQQVLGLQVLSQSPNHIDLGVGKNILIRLIQTEQKGEVSHSYGLYHLAIVLPSREDLGTISATLSTIRFPSKAPATTVTAKPFT